VARDDRTLTRSARVSGGSRPDNAPRRRWFSIPDRPDETQGPEDPEGSAKPREPPSEAEVQDELSREILRIHEESFGKGATSTHTFVGSEYVVVVLDDPELLPNEKLLLENGKHDTVVQIRTRYQHAIQASFRAAVERATGRRVIGFASTTSFEEHRFVAEVFRLE
jgi:uncharacterized protein YbcI